MSMLYDSMLLIVVGRPTASGCVDPQLLAYDEGAGDSDTLPAEPEENEQLRRDMTQLQEVVRRQQQQMAQQQQEFQNFIARLASSQCQNTGTTLPPPSEFMHLRRDPRVTHRLGGGTDQLYVQRTTASGWCMCVLIDLVLIKITLPVS